MFVTHGGRRAATAKLMVAIPIDQLYRTARSGNMCFIVAHEQSAQSFPGHAFRRGTVCLRFDRKTGLAVQRAEKHVALHSEAELGQIGESRHVGRFVMNQQTAFLKHKPACRRKRGGRNNE
jgi:hypothetical protein